jgi:hypothetical protein
LRNNITNLEHIKSLVDQMCLSKHKTIDEVNNIRQRYYQVIKYRFIEEQIFGFIPAYMPILNETYLRANTK